MAAEKISVTVDEDLMKWARGAAKKRKTTLSAVVAQALALQKQHEARERYLDKALAGLSEAEIEARSAEAFREIFGRTDAAE